MTTATKKRVRMLDVLLAPMHLLERTRGRRRKLLILAYSFVGMILGFFVWWITSLNNLPDVGDPFDIKEFIRESKVPDSENAFVLYKKALHRLHDEPVGVRDWQGMWSAFRGGWEKTDPKIRSWVEANRDALELFREGSTRSRALAEDLDSILVLQDDLQQAIVPLTFAAILEGARLEAKGDQAAALEWYLGVTRAFHHYSTKSLIEWRRLANMLEMPLRDRLVSWALNPKTDAASLRKAIAAIQELDSHPLPISDNLKVNYIAIQHSLDNMPKLARTIDRTGSSTYPYNEWRRASHVFWFIKREPERSRRIVSLFFANWLAFCDLGTSARPKAFGNQPDYPIWGYYQAGSSHPESTRAIDPEKLFSWLQSSAVLWRFLTMYPWNMPDPAVEKQSRSTLLVLLAEQAYLRENGKESPSIQSLVPNYLKTIPSEYVEMEIKSKK